MLALMSAMPPSTFYSEPYFIEERAIGESLKRITAMGYSKLLVNLVKVMVSVYRNRPLPSQIYQIFKPH